MKNTVLKGSKLLADAALKVTSVNVNSTCVWYSHQAKLPENAKKLIK